MKTISGQPFNSEKEQRPDMGEMIIANMKANCDACIVKKNLGECEFKKNTLKCLIAQRRVKKVLAEENDGEEEKEDRGLVDEQNKGIKSLLDLAVEEDDDKEEEEKEEDD